MTQDPMPSSSPAQPEDRDPLVDHLADLEEELALERVRTRLAAGEPPSAVIEDCQRGLVVVGERYREGGYYIAGLIMAGEIFREVMEILEPLVQPDAPGTERPNGPVGRVLICTVEGDIHDLGKNLLVMLLRSVGFEVNDLGVDVQAEEIVRVALETRPDIIGLSGMLIASHEAMQDTITKVRAAAAETGWDPQIIVGGGQLSEEAARWIGVAHWSDNAGAAIPAFEELAREAHGSRPQA